MPSAAKPGYGPGALQQLWKLQAPVLGPQSGGPPGPEKAVVERHSAQVIRVQEEKFLIKVEVPHPTQEGEGYPLLGKGLSSKEEALKGLQVEDSHPDHKVSQALILLFVEHIKDGCWSMCCPFQKKSKRSF